MRSVFLLYLNLRGLNQCQTSVFLVRHGHVRAQVIPIFNAGPSAVSVFQKMFLDIFLLLRPQTGECWPRLSVCQRQRLGWGHLVPGAMLALLQVMNSMNRVEN